jgi:thiol-disulfide isomerase/thioredoxin
MRNLGPALLLAFTFSTTALQSQANEFSIADDLKNLRSVPTAKRPAATAKLAADIRALRPGPKKVRYADDLAQLATEGDPGKDVLQSVTDTLSLALTESPVTSKNDQPPMPYLDVAKFVRYEQVTTDLKSPLLDKATQILMANDADIEKVDFTLKDLQGKKVTLSQLRGKIVLVNFWATWCPPCRDEMPDLDGIYTQFQSQGLVVLSISDESMFTIGSYFHPNPYVTPINYHPPILLDTGGKVAKQFHVDSIPKTFVFDREGKLVAQSIDMRTRRQFLDMLGMAGLHP